MSDKSTRRERLKAAWYILTGRPVMFRIQARDGVIGYDCSRGAMFLDCSLSGVDLRQRGGGPPSAAGVECGTHRVALRADGDGNLVCPMDGRMVLGVDYPDDGAR